MLLVTLFVISQTAGATIILGKEKVTQVNSLSVLGNVYTASYVGSVRGVNPETVQDIALLVKENEFGEYYFDGISTDPSHPDAEAWFYGLSESSFYGTGYNFRLNSDRWATGAGGNDPLFEEAYHNHTQNSYIDFKLTFRVDGAGGSILADNYVEFQHTGSAVNSLVDHTSGITYENLYSSVLEDGHVYTFTSLIRNWSVAEHTTHAFVNFNGDKVMVPEPSFLILFTTGLAGLSYSRKLRRL